MKQSWMCNHSAFGDWSSQAAEDKHLRSLDGGWMEVEWRLDGIRMEVGWNTDGGWMEVGRAGRQIHFIHQKITI